MRALVTGGAGFVGSHLVDHLLDLGHTVTAVDDLSTGRTSNLAAARLSNRFSLVKGSVLDRAVMAKLVADADVVFHLAAAVGVHRIVDDPIGSLYTNLEGTQVVLDAVRDHGAAFVLASTSEVYGKNTADRLTEDSDRLLGSPLKCRWSYAEAKALDEMLAYTYHRRHGLRTTIVRLFNTVGPRQSGRYGMVIPRFVASAVRGEPVVVYGDGTQRRCFCWVGDVVAGIVDLADHPGATGSVFNLGGVEEVTIGELARRVVDIAGSGSEVVHTPYEEAYGPGYEDMMRRMPDTTRARDLVGFEPTLSLDEIIRLVIDDHSAVETAAAAS